MRICTVQKRICVRMEISGLHCRQSKIHLKETLRICVRSWKIVSELKISERSS